jgi:D-glycero-D-manno-heptose 1,7-bisphosphate phosphatase
MSAPAVFLDRDGVLNEIVWRDGKPASPRVLSEMVIPDNTPDLIAQLKAAGFKCFVVTNQPDVKRGKMAAGDLAVMHAYMADLLKVDAISACTHDNEDACACRKPKPGLVLDLAEANDIDLKASWMIGDQDRDIECARAAGVRPILLRRDYNSGESAEFNEASLKDAVDVILANLSDHKDKP